MIPPHLFYQIYLSFLEQNYYTPPKCGELSEYTDSAHAEVEDLSSRYTNLSDAYDRCGTTQGNFTLPAPPVRGLPISQDWLDRMKHVRNSTIPIILPSGMNILVDTMFKIIIGYTNLGMRQTQCRPGSRVCPFITPNANMAGYPTKNNVFVLAKLKKTHFRITIPIKRCSSFINCKA